MISTQDIKNKEVINIYDGKSLGFVEDIEVNLERGTIEGIIVPQSRGFFSFFGRSGEQIIKWRDIKRIGDDVILVDVADLLDSGGDSRYDGGCDSGYDIRQDSGYDEGYDARRSVGSDGRRDARHGVGSDGRGDGGLAAGYGGREDSFRDRETPRPAKGAFSEETGDENEK